MAPTPVTESSCVACERPDAADDFVQCDSCDKWWHFSCAGVSESVSDRSWVCVSCQESNSTQNKQDAAVEDPIDSVDPEQTERQQTNVVESNNNQQSASITALSRLKERQSLVRQKMEIELQRKFLEEQQRLMDELIAEEDRKTQRGEDEELNRVQNWIRNSGDDEAGAVGEHINLHGAEYAQQQNPETKCDRGQYSGLAKVFRDLQQRLSGCQQTMNPTGDQISGLQEQLELCRKQIDCMRSADAIQPLNGVLTASEVDRHPIAMMKNDQPVTVSTPLQVRQLGAIPKQRPSYVEEPGKRQAFSHDENKTDVISDSNAFTTHNINNRKEQRSDMQTRNFYPNELKRHPLARSDIYDVHPSNRRLNTNHNVQLPSVPEVAIPFEQPTQQQLAARQSLARDLPTFSGDPAEWPIFISNFEYTTRACGFSDGENMIRLQRCLRGHALESVRNRLVLPSAVPRVIEALRLRYGRPELLINALLQKVRAMPSPRCDRLQGLIEYGLAVQELCDHIEAADQHDHLANPTLLQELVNKLPADQKMMWAGYKRGFLVVNLKTFADYMANVVKDATSVVAYEPEHKKSGNRQKEYVNPHLVDDGQASAVSFSGPSECFNCKRVGHRMKECESFKSLSVDDRWKRVRSIGVCQICLCGHGRRACRSNSRCNISGCQYRHHSLLHGKSSIVSIPRVAENHTHRLPKSNILFRIIPVSLYGSTGRVDTFAFLDEGSQLTLIESGLVTQLGLKGATYPLCLRWTGNTSRWEQGSKLVTVTISGARQRQKFQLSNTRTVENLNLPKQSYNHDVAVSQHPYLRHIPIQSYEKAVPRILIGLDYLRLAVPLKVHEGDGTGPIAVKTRLGWCVYGQHGEQTTESYSFHVCECETDNGLQETLKRFFAVEDNGVTPVRPIVGEEEARAQHLLEKTTKRVGQHFETGLLWKGDDIELPDSYPMAVRRLQCLERKLDRDPALKESFHRQIQQYQDKGYAHQALPDELQKANPKKTWYLPLGVVTNPNKPGKVRVIWDASAKAGGVSLNNMLLKGPDQLTALPAVLFRFRQFGVAVNADVQEMFHQVRIREEDKYAQCFLYRKDRTQPINVFLMDVATFGATCSPTSAQYVKNRNAIEHAQQYSRAAEGILRCHYVDDYLDSFGSVEEAKQVAEDVRKVHRNGGFHLRNWNSNCDDVLRHLGESKPTENKNLYFGDSESTERVLGLLWKPISDTLCFSTRMSDEVRSLIDSGDRPSKRQVLRCVMTLFDPLGLLAPFLIHGKVLIQDLWRTGTGWDEAIGDLQYERWKRWVKMIEFVSTVNIPRCYFPSATEVTYEDAELHAFVDASPTAYAGAVYLRVTDQDGTIRCTLVAGKAKVSPLKPTSIPRLELLACVLGTRLLKFVQEGHTIRVNRRVLWTDSTTAWHWIRSDPRNFKPFVAHRVGEILENTNAAEWRWIRSRHNPADEATKWGRGPYFSSESKWFKGPTFLMHSEQKWPSRSPPTVDTPDEVRASVLYHTVVDRLIDYERFSSWDKLHRTIAYVRRFLNNTASKNHGLCWKTTLQQNELIAAENTLYKLVQLESFPDEMAVLQQNLGLPLTERKSIGKHSQLYQLVPVLDEDGLLRQYSRIGAVVDVSRNMCCPVILPKNHWTTKLLVEKYHRKYRHANAETVLNEIRQMFAISNLRALIKKVVRGCMVCKLRRARPNIPPMAQLPPARLAVHVRPFTHVGLDYFGPLLVKIGRSNVKRWIGLFTCLTVRAVHLEVAYSLSTSSCVRRFVGRRGSPVEFITDNGTNFQGAERMLREQISQGLSSTFTNSTTKWTFIPPGAPHMGGAWERLVQSVKRAMMDAYTEGKVDDEGLQTMVVEAESIVNARPLTYLPLDSAESEALTPNHFLMGSSSGATHSTQISNQNQSRRHPKDMYDQIQLNLDRFWRRWIVEYLPVIRSSTATRR